MKRVSLVFSFVLATLLAVRADAAEPTKEQCIASSENAQLLRRSGKLRASRAGFRACAIDSCPNAIHVDCTEQLRAVLHDLPSVVFSAADGAPSFEVSMDGEQLDERIDGAYIVDPGEHSFTFFAEGRGTVSKQLTIRAGEKGRQEAAPFATPAAHEAALIAGPLTTEPPPTAPPATNDLAHDVGYAGVGVGALGLTVGIVFGIVAKTTYDDAKNHCRADACDVDGADGGRKAHTFAGVATAGFVGGAVLLAGGIALLILGPKSAAAAAIRKNGVLPW